MLSPHLPSLLLKESASEDPKTSLTNEELDNLILVPSRKETSKTFAQLADQTSSGSVESRERNVLDPVLFLWPADHGDSKVPAAVTAPGEL